LLIDHSLRKDFTGFIVAARRLRKVTTAIVTAKTANSARANTQIYAPLVHDKDFFPNFAANLMQNRYENARFQRKNGHNLRKMLHK
jgi:hypothetical protein